MMNFISKEGILVFKNSNGCMIAYPIERYVISPPPPPPHTHAQCLLAPDVPGYLSTQVLFLNDQFTARSSTLYTRMYNQGTQSLLFEGRVIYSI